MEYKKIVETIEKFLIKKTEELNGGVVGLSGGIDSAVVAKLAIDALGKNKVHTIFMPNCKMGVEMDTIDIKILDEYLGRDTYIINIINSFEALIKSRLNLMKYNYPKSINKRLTEGNISSRIRMIILYAFANERNLLVLGTSNKSEIMIGYFTKYGDGGVDCEPIGDLYKTEIWELSKYLGIPQKIIDKKPSAGLWRGQTDEGEIGLSYIDLDAYLKFINNEPVLLRPEVQTLARVKEMIAKTEHKRNMPEVCDISHLK
jgi:NAD+ synthase